MGELLVLAEGGDVLSGEAEAVVGDGGRGRWGRRRAMVVMVVVVVLL
jgi:hypothetical protein